VLETSFNLCQAKKLVNFIHILAKTMVEEFDPNQPDFHEIDPSW